MEGVSVNYILMFGISLCFAELQIRNSYSYSSKIVTDIYEWKKKRNKHSFQQANIGPSRFVTPGFKDKTECITIYMTGSSFIHIETL